MAAEKLVLVQSLLGGVEKSATVDIQTVASACVAREMLASTGLIITLEFEDVAKLESGCHEDCAVTKQAVTMELGAMAAALEEELGKDAATRSLSAEQITCASENLLLTHNVSSYQ